MVNLNLVGIKFGTDKSTLHHHYLGLYELLFTRFLNRRNLRLLEIGTQFGFSLRTWREYFPDALIIGVDTVNNELTPPLAAGTTVIIGQAYEDRMVTDLKHLFYQFDIIIDDASHEPHDQAWFVANYSSLLVSDGLLIVEDVPTKGTIQLLKEKLPPAFDYTAVDMTEGSKTFASRLFIAWRNQ